MVTPPGLRDGMTPNALTRRRFLGLATTGLASALSGCMSGPRSGSMMPATTVTQPTIATTIPPPPATASVADAGYAPPPDFTAQPYTPPVKQAVIPASANGIIPRSVWTKAGPAKPYMPMDGVNLLTFHHDGDPVPFAQDDYWLTAQYLERIRAYHAKSGFQDIGYHFAIDRVGRVWELRPTLYRGEHVRTEVGKDGVLHRWNDHNVGVVVLGNFMLQTPTDAQKQKIRSFGSLLRKQYNLTLAQVKVHQELVATECPGVQLRPYLDQIRQKQLI